MHDSEPFHGTSHLALSQHTPESPDGFAPLSAADVHRTLVRLLNVLGAAGLSNLAETSALRRLCRRQTIDLHALLEQFDRLEATLVDHESAWVPGGAAQALENAHTVLTLAAEHSLRGTLHTLDDALRRLHAQARAAGLARSSAARRVGALRASVQENPTDSVAAKRLSAAVTDLWLRFPVREGGDFPDDVDRLHATVEAALSTLTRPFSDGAPEPTRSPVA